MADELTAHETREAAVLYLAAGAVLGADFQRAEDALVWARKVVRTMETDPTWANGRHEGNCTKEPMTCVRCFVEDAEQWAREEYER